MIINRNDYQNTKECLDSLLANTYSFTFFIIDNDSQDWSKEKLIQEYNLTEYSPWSIDCEQYDISKIDEQFRQGDENNVMISLPENFGFTGANNFWFRFAVQNWYSHIMLLNNDTVVDALFLEQIMQTSLKSNDHIISANIVYFDNPDIIRSCGNYLDFFWMQKLGYNWKNVKNTYLPNTFESKLASWCLLLIPRHILLKTWWQDHKYFFNIDDTDYTYGAYKLWYTCLIDTTIIIKHKVSMSVKGKSDLSTYYYYRNLMLFRNKYFSFHQNILFYCIRSYYFLKSLFVAVITRRRKIATYYNIIKSITTKKTWPYRP